MNNQVIWLTLGSFLVLVVIIIVFKRKKSNNSKRHSLKEKSYDIGINTEKMENSILLERIRRLEYDVSQLKKENNEIGRKDKKDTNLNEKNNIHNFKPVLNYNIFKEKNRNIINLYNKGMSKEDIAKSLNKSIREIEMVVKLIK